MGAAVLSSQLPPASPTADRKWPGLLIDEEPRPVAASVAYLQPGSNTVWPGGWHLAPASFGPFWLLPGPKSGSATAGAAGMESAPTDSIKAKSLRLRMVPPLWTPFQLESGWTSLSTPESIASILPARAGANNGPLGLNAI